MARRNNNDPDERKRKKPDLEQEQEQEVESSEKETTQDKTLQTALGNQGVASMIAAQGGPTLSAGASVEGGMARARSDLEQEGPSFGGDGDPFDDGPLTLEDLIRSFNPRAAKSKDKEAFLEDMPDDELPPEEEEFLAAVQTHPDRIQIRPAQTLDRFLQPSKEVLAASLGHWTRAVTYWSGDTLAQRSLGKIIAPSAPVLQDAHGRVLHARARAGAIATWMLLESPTLLAQPRPEACSLVTACLEIRGRTHRVHNIRLHTDGMEEKLPNATSIFDLNLQTEAKGEVTPRQVDPSIGKPLWDALTTFADLQSAESLVPSLATPPTPSANDDDPLGLDAVVTEMTGGAPDPISSVYQAALQAAEKLAALASRARMKYAAAGAVLADIGLVWTGNPAALSLRAAMEQLDSEISEHLRLLVEIARATKAQSVPPEGIRNGLRRVSRGLDRSRGATQTKLVQIMAGLLPPVSRLQPPPGPVDDPFASALDEPARAVHWLAAQPDGFETRLARMAMDIEAAVVAAELCDRLDQLKREAASTGRPLLAAALSSIEGSARLQSGDYEGALKVASASIQFALARNNGLAVAEAALTAMEAFHALGALDRAQALRLDVGRALHVLNSSAGLSLLARWKPYSSEDVQAAAGSYPQTEHPSP